MSRLFFLILITAGIITAQIKNHRFGFEVGGGASFLNTQKIYLDLTPGQKKENKTSKSLSPGGFFSYHFSIFPVMLRSGYSFAFLDPATDVDLVDIWGVQIDLYEHNVFFGVGTYKFGFELAAMYSYSIRSWSVADGYQDNWPYDGRYTANDIFNLSKQPSFDSYSPHHIGIYLSYWRIGAQAMFGEHSFQILGTFRVFEL